MHQHQGCTRKQDWNMITYMAFQWGWNDINAGRFCKAILNCSIMINVKLPFQKVYNKSRMWKQMFE